jgi:hypothetical protein
MVLGTVAAVATPTVATSTVATSAPALPTSPFVGHGTSSNL